MFPNPEFIAKTLEDFPDAGVANVEQARALISDGGYVLLDVRSKLAYDDGKVPGSIHVPYVIGKSRWDSETRSRAYEYTDVENWIDNLKKVIPDKETKIVVMCSTGTQNAIRALETLDENEYYNIVGLKGGYRAWNRVFDLKLARRVYGEYAENWSSGDGDFQSGETTGCGIHASGAGFAKVDPINLDMDVIH
jgi:rhodanese-related sulfurtransferase